MENHIFSYILFFYSFSVIFTILLLFIFYRKFYTVLNLKRIFSDISENTQDWNSEKIHIKDPFSDREFEINSFNFKRSIIFDNEKKYGVDRVVDNNRSLLDRQLIPYERIEEIKIPEISHDSKVCDEWSENGKFVECRVDEGFTACFNCIESRKFVRSCIHVEMSFNVTKKDGSIVSIPANSNKELGWCLPENFKNLQYENDSIVPKDIKKNCNPNTGEWLLSQLGNDNGNFDSSYNWICKCRYPNLMTNLIDLSTDCLNPVGCGHYGELDEKSKKGLVDPYNRGFCICQDTHNSDFDKTVGPVCVAKNIYDYDNLENLYNFYGLNFGKGLPRLYISEKFLSFFPENKRDKIVLPNPCTIDMISGDLAYGCSIELFKIDGKSTAVCVSRNSQFIAIKTQTDYLLNNHGNYPNACLSVYNTVGKGNWLVTDNLDNPIYDTPTLNSVLSFYNNKKYPDVGIICSKFDNYMLNKIFLEIIEKDTNWINWKNTYFKDPVKIDPIMEGKPRFHIKIMDITSNQENSFVVYEDWPDVLGKSWWYTNVIKSYETNNKTFLVFGRPVNYVYREFYNEGGPDYVAGFKKQSPEEYNKDLTENEVRLIDIAKKGQGRMPVDKPLFLAYIEQPNDMEKMEYRSTIKFFSDVKEEKEKTFPAKPLFCSHDYCLYVLYKGNNFSNEWIRPNYISKLWPAVYKDSDLPFVPNPRFFNSDVMLFFTCTKNHSIIFSERFGANVMNYQSNDFPNI